VFSHLTPGKGAVCVLRVEGLKPAGVAGAHAVTITRCLL
jgi:hypothetical protein